MKEDNLFRHIIKYCRLKKRISVKNMAKLLEVKETDIRDFEGGNIRKYPMGFIITYLNHLGFVLSLGIKKK
jgi:hypothetical protein